MNNIFIYDLLSNSLKQRVSHPLMHSEGWPVTADPVIRFGPSLGFDAIKSEFTFLLDQVFLPRVLHPLIKHQPLSSMKDSYVSVVWSALCFHPKVRLTQLCFSQPVCVTERLLV